MAHVDLGSFASAEDSLDWADAAINELRSEIELFFADPGVSEYITRRDPSTGELVAIKRFVRTLPRDLSRKPTEAINNTKHSFDQTVNAALFRLRDRRDGSGFPWASSPADLDQRIATKGIPEELWSAIKDQEPYKRSDAISRGDDLTRSLAAIANQKHSVGLGISAFRVQRAIGNFTSSGRVTFRSECWDAVAREIELARIARGAHFTGEYGIRIDVLLSEPKLGQPVEVVTAFNSLHWCGAPFPRKCQKRLS